MSKESNRLWLDGEIRKINPSGDSTSLEQGLLTARRLLETQNRSAEAEVVIVSDGGIGNIGEGDNRFERAVNCAASLHESGIGIHFVHIHAPKTDSREVTPNGKYYTEILMNKIGLPKNYNRIEPGQRVNVSFSEKPEESEDKEENYSSGSLTIYDPKHFITRDISEINHDLLGYNEVTPKPEANRLVITRLGKPVITVWRLGLGRVAAITTDNGYGHGIPWASSLYSGNDSLIVTRTLNWAVADTEMSENIQLKVPDLKVNQPGRILITTKKGGAPELYFDKKRMEITPIGNSMYESYVTPKPSASIKSQKNLLEHKPDEKLTLKHLELITYPGDLHRQTALTSTHISAKIPLFRTALLENGGKIYTTGRYLFANNNRLLNQYRKESYDKSRVCKIHPCPGLPYIPDIYRVSHV